MSVSRNGRRALTVGVTAAVAGTALFTGVGQAVAVAPTAKASASLLSASGAAISLTGTGFRTGTGANYVTGATVFFATTATGAAATCAASGGTAVGHFSNVSTTKISLTTPSAVAAVAAVTPSGATSVKANLCLAYNDGVAKWVSVPLVFALQPVKNATTPLAPVKGLLVGGQSLAVATTAGTGWPAGSTVWVGGLPATTNKISTDGKSISAVSPAGVSPGAVSVVVKDAGFKDVVLTGAYTYVDGITITPSTTLPSTITPIDIVGSGFTGSDFGVVFDDATPAAVTVNLWDGSYSSPGVKNVTNCPSVQVISDTELTCDAPANAATVWQVSVSNGPVTEQAAETAAVASYAAATPAVVYKSVYVESVLSTTSVFTVADF